jgi:ribulose 1,5-bisphosphate synthetase/thiazole synthase
VARGAYLGGTALLGGALAACGGSEETPVAIVGGGLAGLSCAREVLRRRAKGT